MTLLEQIQKEHAAAFTHGGKFHADDVFSAALLIALIWTRHAHRSDSAKPRRARH